MHHAFLLVGEYDSSLQYIDEADKRPGPDVSFITHERFGIKEARALKRQSNLRPVERAYRVFVLSMRAITAEAQNALLKLFEEPGDAVRFYVIVKDGDIFIPTLRSRFMEIDIANKKAPQDSKMVLEFLNIPYRERLAAIAQHMKEKDTLWAEVLLDNLEMWAEKHRDTEIMRDVLFVRRYDRSRSASRKMLLEHIALTLPESGPTSK